MPAVAGFGFIVAIALTHMADVPYQNSLDFHEYWKLRLVKKVDRTQFLTCFPVGIFLGPYGIANASLGLLIIEDIVNNTITLLVLGIIE